MRARRARVFREFSPVRGYVRSSPCFSQTPGHKLEVIPEKVCVCVYVCVCVGGGADIRYGIEKYSIYSARVRLSFSLSPLPRGDQVSS